MPARDERREQTILLADPEADFVEWAISQLQADDVRVISANDAESALELYEKERPDLLLAELRLTPFSGLELLEKVRGIDPNATVLLTSAFATNQAVIEAMKLGAFDFVRKESLPFNIKVVVGTALQSHAEMKKAKQLDTELTVEHARESIIGQSDALQNVFKIVGRVAHSDVPVLITGESGSGKELVARAVHTHSQRAKAPFVAINCAAIPEQLLESELFGHEKGSFTGAVSQRIGRFEQCTEGTLFLDEIGDMPMALQSKILRVLQDGEFSRVGGNSTLKTHARIVAATNKNLEKEVQERTFREDLFYRLNVVRIHLPPLRERKQDIRLLADYFLQKIAREKGLPRLFLSEEAAVALENYKWPGNIRELENTIQRAVVLANTEVLLPKDIPLGDSSLLKMGSVTTPAPTNDQGAPDIAEPSGAPDPEHAESSATGKPNLEQALEILLEHAEADEDLQLLPWLEREFTKYAMQKTGGNQVRSAQLLGVTRATLRKRIERFGITKELKVR